MAARGRARDNAMQARMGFHMAGSRSPWWRKRGSHSRFPIISRHPFIVSAWLPVSQEEIVEGLALVRGMRCAPFTADLCHCHAVR